MVIVLLILTFLATVLYGGNAEQKAKLNNNFFWQKTRIVFDSTLGFLGAITEIGLIEVNDSDSENSNSQNLNQENLNQQPDNTSNLFSSLTAKVKNAWDESSDGENSINGSNDKVLNNEDKKNSIDSNVEKFVEWRPIIGGAEVIFKLKNGQEYKFILPFKFLGQKNTI
jgi:hypothetical protein